MKYLCYTIIINLSIYSKQYSFADILLHNDMSHLFSLSSCWISVGSGNNVHDCLCKREFGYATCTRHRFLENSERVRKAISAESSREIILEAEKAQKEPNRSLTISRIPSPPLFVNYVTFIKELNVNYVSNNINVTFCQGKGPNRKKIPSTKNNTMIISRAISKTGRQSIKSLPSKRAYMVRRFEKAFDALRVKRSERLSAIRKRFTFSQI